MEYRLGRQGGSNASAPVPCDPPVLATEPMMEAPRRTNDTPVAAPAATALSAEGDTADLEASVLAELGGELIDDVTEEHETI